MKTNISDKNYFFNASTRQQAINNGALIDVSTMANEIGFNVTVAISQSAWHKVMSKLTTDQQKNDYLKILLEVLFSDITALSIVLVNPSNTYDFTAPTPTLSYSSRTRAVKLKSITGVGDLDTSVITIILTSEDKS